ncbi:MAG: dTMP kinase, partial [Eubacteriales bacterium]
MNKFIVLEGLDGSGKGTQTELLRDYLARSGRRVRVLDFPAYGTKGAALVELYLGGGLGSHPDDTNAYAASMFFAADRYVSYVSDWHADYSDPETFVIANRYTTANAYHQISKLPR